MNLSSFRTLMAIRTCSLAAIAAFGMTIPAATHAQTQASGYPSRPIRIVVPFSPGGVVDFAARLVSQKLSENAGWQVVVENRPGGNGFIGVGQVAKSAADGYTLLMAHTGEFTVNPAVFANVPYDLKRDFSPITIISDTPMLLVANSASPYNTFKDVIDAARKAPDQITYSSAGTGSINHLMGEWISVEGGVKLLHVPYKGGAPAAAAVVAGEVPLSVAAVSVALPYLKSGRLKAIGLTTAKRSSYDPSWPTAQEGGIPQVDGSNWVGLFSPKGVPADIQATIYREVSKVLQTPDVKRRFADTGAEVGGMPPAEFAARIETDARKMKEVVARANVRVD